MHAKREFAKIKGSICNIPIEVANIRKIFRRPADSNGLIMVKWKQDLNYRGYVYFDPISLNLIYQTLNCLRTRNRFYEDISFSEGFSSKEMMNFSGIDKHQDLAKVFIKISFRMKNETIQLRIHQP